jgi:prepilin-type N-terminal cleavage/methylation domain-containing protein
MPSSRAFTLIELLVVVAIVAILAAIGLVNFRQATERALKSADAAQLRVVGLALQRYHVDHGAFPLADREAGPFPSHTPEFTAVGNGPAAGGSWDGVPWLLVDLGYITDPRQLFTPKYLRLYPGGTTIRGGHPRYHNFRYAYNSSAASSGGPIGGSGNIGTENTWLVRNLFVAAEDGWFGAQAPDFPADYAYPYGEGDDEGRLEHVLTKDMVVRTVVGGTMRDPESE